MSSDKQRLKDHSERKRDDFSKVVNSDRDRRGEKDSETVDSHNKQSSFTKNNHRRGSISDRIGNLTDRKNSADNDKNSSIEKSTKIK